MSEANPTRGKRRAARRKRLIVWSSVALILLLGALGAKPIYHALKRHRANALAEEAETLAGKGELNQAAAKYRAALQLDPLGYRPLVGAARLATRADRPEATDLWQQVTLLPESSVADRLEYIALLIQRGAYKTAEKLLEESIKTAPDSKTLTLAAQLASRQSNESKALDYARQAAARLPADGALRFQLAQYLAHSADESKRAEAIRILWSLAENAGPQKKAAIEALARSPDLTVADEQKVLATLDELPDRSVVLGLLGSELKLKLHPDDAENIYREALEQWSKASAVDLGELARWLSLHQQFDRVLNLIPLERALTSEPLLLSRLDALAGLQNWSEIDAILERPDLQLDPAVIESFRARSEMGKGSALNADLHWDRAIALAGGNMAKLRFVGSFAEQSRASGPALRAYEQLSRFPEQAAFAERGRQRLLDQTGDVASARTAAEKLNTILPDDVNAQAQLTHLNLLLGLEVEANLEKAIALSAKYPTRLSFRVTAALGYLRTHNADAALAQFDGPPVDWSRTPAGWRAIYAASLAANDRTEEGRALITGIPPDRLNKEERELIAPLTQAPSSTTR